MKQTGLMDRIQEDMRPGVITRAGFLGSDTRNLADVLEADDAAVKRLGLTHEQVAQRMRDLREAGKKGLGQTVRVEDSFEVAVDGVRGKLPCPFRDGHVFPKVNTTVRNLRLGREITYTDLSIHMIEVHGFYQGRGAPFRQEPANLVEILEIVPVADG